MNFVLEGFVGVLKALIEFEDSKVCRLVEGCEGANNIRIGDAQNRIRTPVLLYKRDYF